jgi:hypothetical protein
MMREHLRRNILLGLAAAAVIAGVIIAITSSGGHDRHPHHGLAARSSGAGEVGLTAEYLGIGVQQLHAKLRAGESTAEMAEATPGKSAAGLVADLLAHRRRAILAAGGGPAEQQQALARERAQIVAQTNHSRGRNGTAQTAADYLGISEAAVRRQLRTGRSLAQIAADAGKSRAGLVDALVAVKAKRLRTARAERVITAAEEQTALGKLHARVLLVVEQQRTPTGH